jgi:alanine-glyoxylate transaminase/serine-glyoxylate transaminase/serine-pyruvate transaminase
MTTILSSWRNPHRLLMGPGPSNVHPRILLAMGQQTIGHLDPSLFPLMDEIQHGLRRLFGTRNRVTFPVSGTGMAGMEACLSNLLEPGDRAVVGVHGFFGERLCEVAGRCGAEVTRIDSEWGRPLNPDRMAEAIRNVRPRLVAFVHAETSTGVLQAVEEIAAAARDAGALVVLDTVTSLGGIPVELDRWGVDAAYSGTQKCVGCPSGLSPASFSDAAMERIRGRRGPVQSFYLDVSLLSQYWGSERPYHHTVPANMLFALAEALALIDEEGLEARQERHRRNAGALREGLEAMGLRLFAQPGCRLPSLTTVCIPDGVEDLPVRQALLDRHNVEIGGGLGPVRGKVWRIGLMGYGSAAANVLQFLSALEAVLRDHGARVGSGVAAASAALSASGPRSE